MVHQETILKFVREGNRDAAKELLIIKLRDAQLAYFDQLNKLISFPRELVETAGAEAVAQYESALTVMIALAATGLLLACAVAFLVTRGITRPLNKAVTLATK